MKSTLAAIALAFVVAACGNEGEDQALPPTGTDRGEQVVAFVERFMMARQAGLPADEFMTRKTQTAYETHASGLWLYDDTLPGGAGGEYQRFSIGPAREGDQQSWTVEVRILVRWDGEAPPSDIVEVLTVRSGLVAGARRADDPENAGLPLAVAKTREAIYRAAVTHDYETLGTLLDPETFSYSFGEEGDPIGYWRRQEEEGHLPVVGDILPGVLHTRFGVNEGIYVWPSAAAKLPQDWAEADIQAMRDAGYRNRDIRAFEEQVGGYAGWRAGIRADGTWLYFISGD